MSFEQLENNFPIDTTKHYYILNLPDNYQGAYMFRCLGDSKFASTLKLKTQVDRTSQITEVLSYNLLQPFDSVKVSIVDSLKLKVELSNAGSWWWRYTVGANDPEIIDSIRSISQRPVADEEPVKTVPPENPIAIAPPPPVKRTEEKPIVKTTIPKEETKPVVVIAEPVKPVTIEEKFVTRKKVLIKDIPLSGDSLELRFYDNAEIDGDSISLFLNDKLLFQHIRLTGNAYSIKIPISEMNETNELIMVAENLGAIPPNTSYMLAIVGDKRYDAYLASTEGSSAMVRFTKKSP